MNPTRSNQARWFVEEVERHGASLKAYLRSSFPSLRDVDDVVQSSYLRMWRRSDLSPVRSARAFLFTVAKRLALDSLRSERRSPIVASTEFPKDEAVDERNPLDYDAERTERIRLLIAAIDRLPHRCREVVVLRKLKLMSQREVAEKLGISEKGVENQLARGITRCREFLRRNGAHDYFVDS